MMEYVLQGGNSHNVMNTDVRAAEMCYPISDNLPLVFRSSVLCQHKLKCVHEMHVRGGLAVLEINSIPCLDICKARY